MFKIKLSNYLSNIKKINEISTNEILNSFCFPVDSNGQKNFSELLLNNFSHYFYWNQPENNYSFCAIDKLKSFSGNGKDRVFETQNIINNSNFVNKNNFNEYNIGSVPMFVGGMKFSSGIKTNLWNRYEDSDWFIPKYLFLSIDGKQYFIYNFFFDENKIENILEQGETGLNYLLKEKTFTNPDTNYIIKTSNFNQDYDKSDWMKKVETALDKIDKGEIKKVVLSRKVKMEFEKTSNISVLLSKLSKSYPRCYVFAYGKEDSIFFGASPEKLAKLSDGFIEADALAGSFPRGRTELEDKILANELMISKKNRAEQQAVVDSITKSFESFSSQIIYDNKPQIRKLPNIQHLWTPIKAKLNNGKSILSILKEIHPTPAICGTPYNAALLSIKKSEEHDRGLYAGIIGWFNFENQGEFAVAIRSALIKGNELHAFAGCGIVQGSDPEAEYAETKLKLRPISSLFEYESVN